MESILETKAATILQFIQGLRGSLHVTFEEGTCAAWLHDLLKPHVTKVLVCDPRKNALLKAGNKNDRMDARYAHALSGGQTGPPGTDKRLQAVQKGVKFQEEIRPDPIALQDLRTLKLPRLVNADVSAEFFMLFAPGPKVVDAKFVSGSEQLRDATKVLETAHFDVPFPEGSPAQILRRGLLSCESKVPQCLFVLIPPNSVDSVK
jgi:hypothetical protein